MHHWSRRRCPHASCILASSRRLLLSTKLLQDLSEIWYLLLRCTRLRILILLSLLLALPSAIHGLLLWLLLRPLALRLLVLEEVRVDVGTWWDRASRTLRGPLLVVVTGLRSRWVLRWRVAVLKCVAIELVGLLVRRLRGVLLVPWVLLLR